MRNFCLRLILLLWPVLASAVDGVYISEFLASNRTGLRDEDNDQPDWIEIHNSGAVPVDLRDWSLTDDQTKPREWVLPAVTIDPKGFLVVFASGKDRAVAGQPLHTSFKLSSAGGYLALLRPDRTLASEFPAYPGQYDDKPYGIGQAVVVNRLVAPTAPLKVFIPTGSIPADPTWTARTYDDSVTGWSTGSNGVGYESTVPGFAFKTWFANVSFGSTAGANAVIANPSQQTSYFAETRAVVNFLNSGSDGNYPQNSNPAWLTGSDREYYVVEATGRISIPTSGVWTFGVNSDDGFELQVDGVNVCAFDGGRGAGDTLGQINLTAGEHTIRVMIYEMSGGSSGELFAKAGAANGWDPAFRLVGDTANGGLAVSSVPLGTAGSGYAPHIGRNIGSQMKGVSSSAYVRIPFSVSNPASLSSLTMPIRYDDGFVAYVNGSEVARRNASGGIPSNTSLAPVDRLPVNALAQESIDLTAYRNLIVPASTGLNVLAIHGLNLSVNDGDFLLQAELADYQVTPGEISYFTTATPGTFNTAAVYNKVSPVAVSQERGLFAAPFSVSLTTGTPGATIRYTFDGSTPTQNSATSATYTAPIQISRTTTLRYAAFKAGSDPSEAITNTYLFPADVATQSPNGEAPVISNPPGSAQSVTSWPAPVDSGGQVLNYGMDPAVVNSPAYAGSIVSDLKSLPLLSIVTDLANLFDPSTGIYVQPGQDGIAWERAASLELINPDGAEGFQANCGIRIRGGFSRSTDNPKHSFRLFFRSIYGPSKLEYPLFGVGVGAQKFDKFDLRTSQNYSWAFQGDGGNGVFLRDVFSRDSQLALGQPSSHGFFYHLYINGQYWGIYNIDERPEANFGATYFGGDADDYDTVKVDTSAGYTIHATDGNLDAWFSLWQQADAGLAAGNSEAQNNAVYQALLGNDPDGARNPAFPVLLDPVNLIDEMLIVLYGGNLDAPTSAFLGNENPNNWYGVRNRTGLSGGFKFILHDSEHTLLDVNADRTGPFPAGDSDLQGDQAFGRSSPQTIWQQCLHSQEFRALLGDRVQKHCFNGGPLTPAAAIARFDARKSEIDRAVVAESARWGDSKREPALTRDEDWLGAIGRVRSSFFPGRTAVLISQLRGKGYISSIEAPGFSQRGGSVQAGFSLTLSNPNANPAGQVIYYTLDGSDPRLLGSAVSPRAIAYASGSPIILESSRFVRARIKSSSQWSALEEATFYVQVDYTRLAITEIHYNPVPSVAGGTDADEFEFVELKNVGSNALDLSGLSFTSGLTFSFATQTTLQPGAFLVLVRNPAKFAQRYPAVAIHGMFTGRLDNGGEKLEITHTLGGVALSAIYSDSAPWPITPDGAGFSLVAIGSAGFPDPNAATTWRASANIHGSPGMEDPAVILASVVINEALANPAQGQSDAIELYNAGPTDTDISYWWLTDDSNNPMRYQIPAGTTIPAGGYLTFTEAQFNSTPGVLPAFAFSSSGESVYILAADSAGKLTGYSHGFSFGASAEGVSFGRYLNSLDTELFPAQKARSFGAVNSGPVVGPIVISEIMYHPPEGFDEFVELQNITSSPVLLYDPANPGNTWKLNGASFTFPQGAQLPANGIALATSLAADTFRAKYRIPPEVQIFGPLGGALSDGGERISIQRPGVPVPGIPPTVPAITVDSLKYLDRAPWPVSADGAGPSLQRVANAAFGDDPTNWFASGITPGRTNALNISPAVSLSSPSAGSFFTLPTSIVLQASASDPDGTVTRVEFFSGGTKLGEAYASPFQFVWSNAAPGTHLVTARATDNVLGVTTSSSVMITVQPPPIGNGLGLTARYHNTRNFSGTPVVRTDPTVDLDFSSSFPPAGINQTEISVRWTGQILPRLSGTYTFHTMSDDGVRLFVDGREILSNYTDHAPVEDIGFINLEAGRLYDIRLEWFQGGGGAIIQLFWSATAGGLQKQIIPQSQLYPEGAPIIVTQPRSQTVEHGSTASFSVVASGTAPLSYQWRRNSDNLAGATQSTLVVTDVQRGQDATYSVRVSNGMNATTSGGAALTVTFTDSDNDGMNDIWEIANGLNANSSLDAALDSDSDGLTNKSEFLAGTDPRSAGSVLRVTVTMITGGAKVQFVAQSNKRYSVQYKNALNDPAWLVLQDVPAAVGPRDIAITDLSIGQVGARFYRVVVFGQ